MYPNSTKSTDSEHDMAIVELESNFCTLDVNHIYKLGVIDEDIFYKKTKEQSQFLNVAQNGLDPNRFTSNLATPLWQKLCGEVTCVEYFPELGEHLDVFILGYPPMEDDFVSQWVIQTKMRVHQNYGILDEETFEGTSGALVVTEYFNRLYAIGFCAKSNPKQGYIVLFTQESIGWLANVQGRKLFYFMYDLMK